jgi:hypothetical protein
MLDRAKVKFGEPLPGYRFKPGECIVNSDFANEFRQGICTHKELDDLKMLVVEAGIDRMTQNESYGLLYYSIAGGDSGATKESRACLHEAGTLAARVSQGI